MNLIKMFFRNKQQTSVDVFECWEVRWRSRTGEYSGDTQPEVRVFPNKLDAILFQSALKDAFKLIRQKSGTVVDLSKQAETI